MVQFDSCAICGKEAPFADPDNPRGRSLCYEHAPRYVRDRAYLLSATMDARRHIGHLLDRNAGLDGEALRVLAALWTRLNVACEATRAEVE